MISDGTAVDTSLLIEYISSYAFPHSDRKITQHLVLGVSLGGHAAWHCILHDPSIVAAVVIIGCPDYVSLMSDRARLSKLQTWTRDGPPGSRFVGSKDFPKGLVEVVERYDPAGLLLGDVHSRNEDTYRQRPSEHVLNRLLPLMRNTLQNKRILNLSGGADKLVPYKCGEQFIAWLKRAIGPGGWFADGGVVLEDVIFEGVGHAMSPDMAKEAIRFIRETLEAGDTPSPGRPSKI
ncbi:hypothetical protein MMC09_006832 [Bachmanniomyces sp. S44760]|nr:hypothetical protein [Bachmanniomyces sp. S44760]